MKNSETPRRRPFPAQEPWPIGFGSGTMTRVEWVPAPQQVNLLSDEVTPRDTLQLEALGVSTLEQILSTLIPDRDGYRPSQWGSARSCPPVGSHREYSEVAEQAGRAGTAIALLRGAFGLKAGVEKEAGMYRVTARHVKHGLPSQPKPDDYMQFFRGELPDITDEVDLGHFVDIGFAVPLVLEAWIMRYEVSGDSALHANIDEAIAELRHIAVRDPSGNWYYPTRNLTLDSQGDPQWGGAYPNAGGGSLVPLAHWATITQDPDLLDFVRSVADGIVAGAGMPLESQTPRLGRVRRDGTFELDIRSSKWAWPGGNIPEIANPILIGGFPLEDQETEVHPGHTHVLSQSTVAWGMAYAGMATGDARYLDWAAQVYHHLLATGNDTGWFPEHLPWPYPVLKDPRQHTETCITADMADIAAWLARAGRTDYWDHVERYGRNYLSEMQLHVTPEFEAYYRSLHASRPQEEVDAAIEALRARLDGGYVASCLVNDMVIGLDDEPSMDVMGCCTWSGGRGIGRVGASVVEERDDGVYVNLALSHDGPAARVVSFLPSVGRVTVVAKRAGSYFVRPPAWAPRTDVRAYRDAKPVRADWHDRYIRFDGARAGEELTITYPLPHFLQELNVHGREVVNTYTLEWLGNATVGVAPDGDRLPLYDDRAALLAAAGVSSFFDED